MRFHISVAVRMILITIIITGILYPALVLVSAQAVFPGQANGSLVSAGGHTVGSKLIGQQFDKPEYFHPRPSAAGNGYDATASGGFNLGPTSKVLDATIKERVDLLTRGNPTLRIGNIPVDMVTASASGLDPDISIANAYAQAPRVAKARHISISEVTEIIEVSKTGRQFLVLGEPRVNVLLLNMALDKKGHE